MSTPSQGLETCALPAGAISEKAIPGIRTRIEQVLTTISKSAPSAGSKGDNQAIKSCILTFQAWLKEQGCIRQVSTTYDIEKTETYPENIFLTYPGQLPFDIVFNMEGSVQTPYRLLIFVTSLDLLTFGSLVENRSLEGVSVPQNWPKDPLSYWEDRP